MQFIKLVRQSFVAGLVTLLALPGAPSAEPAKAPTLAPGKWELVEWWAPTASRQVVTVTIGENDGKPVATAAQGEGFRWQATDLTVSGGHVRMKLTRDGSTDYHFEGLFDPADSARIIGSLKMDVTNNADRAVLELIESRRARKTPRAEPPAGYQKWVELEGERFNAEIAAERAAKDKSPDAAKARAAADAAKKKYDAEVPKLLRKLALEQANNAFGFDAVERLLFRLDVDKPTVAEVESWVKLARSFAATHGRQFETVTLGRIATTKLIRHAEFAALARKFAAEADKLAAEAGVQPEYVKTVAQWDEERAAWASQPKPPAAVWTVTLNGKVTDAKGAPIAGAEVLVNSLQWVKVLWQDGSNKATTGPDGRYAITLKCQGTSRAHITKMWAEKAGLVRAYDTERHKLLPGESTTVDFMLKPGEAFGGTLKINRRPFDSDADLQMLEVKGDSVWELVTVRNGEKFSLLLPPGTYTVELHRGRNNLTWTGLKSGSADHVFEEPAFQFTAQTVGAGFDEMWKAMDRDYSYFILKPHIDWPKLRDEYRPKAVQAKSADELAAVLKEMLGRLQDGHIWIMTPVGEQIGTHRAVWSYNGNRKVVLEQLTDTTECGDVAVVGKTKPDGFGYFLMKRQSAATPELVKKAVAAIEKLADAPGFIVDLRHANGGSEPLAAEIARLFCAKKVVYAKSKFRDGRGHDEFTQDYPRELLPAKSGKPYVKPVVCLLGPGCVSSGEGFAQMLAALPHVTTVGLPTRGSSGNPGSVDVGDTGLTVYFSRWVDMMPDGTTIEGKGVPVAVRVDAAAEAYKDADPTLAKGLEVLRAKSSTK